MATNAATSVVPPIFNPACTLCNGSGRRGILGPAGLGMFAFPCPMCSSTSSSGAQPQIDVVGKPVVDPGGIGVAEGVPHRMDYKNPDSSIFAKLPAKRQNNKLDYIRVGGDLASEHPVFPAARQYRDVCWTISFIIVALAVLGMCIYYMSSAVWEEAKLEASDGDDVETYPSLGEIISCGVVACVVSAIAAAAYMFLARTSPSCVVYTSLIFGPAFTMAIGIALIALESVLAGVILIILGFLSLFCTFCCWGHLIPFTIEVVRIVSRVALDNPMMLCVSLVGTILAISWSFVVIIPVAGFYLEHLHGENTTRGIMYVFYFFLVLLLVWGSFVAYNVCHVTYCGVFGRWFYDQNRGYRLRMSLNVALTTAFGSICYGSFLIAGVRALEAVARLAKNDSAESGNMLCCVIFCIVECVLSCIGDILEYFSEWAYVQVAVRGTSFCDSVKITFSRCTCAYIDYIVSDLLLNSVVNMGALLCGASGALAGAVIGFGMGGGLKAMIGSLVGLWCGILAGGAAVGMITSGAKTILTLWAESSDGVRANFPELNELSKEFSDRIQSRM